MPQIKIKHDNVGRDLGYNVELKGVKFYPRHTRGDIQPSLFSAY